MSAAVFALGMGAGAFGALFGVGGGVILVPVLTLWLGVPMPAAVGTSLFCVIASSPGLMSSSSPRLTSNMRSTVRCFGTTPFG